MSTFTSTGSSVRFTDTDGDVSFTATRPAVTFTAAYQSVTGSGGGASDLDDLTDVTITAAASGDILRHNGTAFVDTLGTDHFEASGAVSTHNASGAAHSDIRTLVAARSSRWTVDVVGGFGPGFDELVPANAFGTGLSWGDDYYFYQTPPGENLTAQATNGTTIACVSYLLGAVDGYAGDITQEGIWTLTGGVWVRDSAQPLAGEIVGQDTGSAAWQLGNTYIKASDGHLEHANLQYIRGIIAQQTIIETYTADATVDATTSGAKTGFGRCDATSAAFTVTLVAAASNRGRSILFTKIDSSGNAVSIDGAGSETINGSTSAVTLTTQWDWVRLTSDGTGWVATRGGSGGGTVDVVSNVAQDRILGRTSSGSGNSEELTASTVRTFLGNYIVGGQDAGTAVTDSTHTLTSENSLLDATVAMPALAAGDTLFVDGVMSLLNNSGSARSYTLNLKVGSTAAAALTIASLTASATTRSVAISGYIRANASADGDAMLCTTGGGIANIIQAGYGTTAEAIQTAGVALDVTVTGSANTATQQIQLQSLVVRKVAAA